MYPQYNNHKNKFLTKFFKCLISWASGAHTCNPNYSRSRDWAGLWFQASPGKSLQNPISINSSALWCVPVIPTMASSMK
jgi:hypothetical protein